MVQAKLDTAPQKGGHHKRRPHQQLPASRKSGGGPKQQQQRKDSHCDDVDKEDVLSRWDFQHHQRLLNVFRRAFNEVLTDADFESKQQVLKQALFERNFAKAFADPASLPVYAARWSPTRSLCYASVLKGIRPHLGRITCTSPVSPSDEDEEASSSSPQQDETRRLKVLSIGGCAAELAAFASLVHHLPPFVSGEITLLDSAPWASVVSSLTETLTTPPPISKYASASARLSAEKALVDPASRLSVSFLQKDIITLPAQELASVLGSQTSEPLLVTIMFTLNELFTASGIGKTTLFLQTLTSHIPFGSLLLVVDSAGSYSEATVGKEQKKYPMQWLLDHIVLATQKTPVEGRTWKKVESNDSVWYRHNTADSEYLDYPIPLENMRYQMHLYKVVDSTPPDEDEDNSGSDSY